MPVVAMLLSAALATLSTAAPYPRPSQPDYSVAKAFAAIVARDAEVNIQDLSYAFDLPKLYQGFRWNGPFGGNEAPRFSAYYDPPNSSVGITKIAIEWDFLPPFKVEDKSTVSLRLSISLRPDDCPSELEMVAATGVPMTKFMAPGTDGGPSYPVQFFNMPDGNGHTKSIQYSRDPCVLSATYVRQN